MKANVSLKAFPQKIFSHISSHDKCYLKIASINVSAIFIFPGIIFLMPSNTTILKVSIFENRSFFQYILQCETSIAKYLNRIYINSIHPTIKYSFTVRNFINVVKTPVTFFSQCKLFQI